MTIQHRFNLFGENFAASQIDDGGFAREQEQKTIFVHTPDVAGEEPTIAQHFFTRNPRRDIRIEDSRPEHGEFATAVRVWIDDAYFKLVKELGIGGPISMHLEYSPFEKPPASLSAADRLTQMTSFMKKDLAVLKAVMAKNGVA